MISGSLGAASQSYLPPGSKIVVYFDNKLHYLGTIVRRINPDDSAAERRLYQSAVVSSKDKSPSTKYYAFLVSYEDGDEIPSIIVPLFLFQYGLRLIV